MQRNQEYHIRRSYGCLGVLCGCSQRFQRFEILADPGQNLTSLRSQRTSAECAEKAPITGTLSGLEPPVDNLTYLP